MAELNVSSGKSGKRTKKTAPRVDLTAMVDLAFLLVTFFMLTTTLTKQKAMDLTMPIESNDPDGWAASRTMTICLGKNDKVLCYLGETDHPIVSKMVDYKKEGLRKMLTETGQSVMAKTGKPMIVIVKPSAHSIYDNLVNALDELNITDTKTYAIADISPKDIDLLKLKNAF